MITNQVSKSFIINEIQPEQSCNEDYIINCPIEHGDIYIIANGIGNKEDRGVAAQLVALTIKDHMNMASKSIIAQLKNSIFVANQVLIDYITSHKYISGIGCSVIVAIETKETLYYTIIGNSQIFLYRDKELEKITHKNIYHNTELKYLGNSTLKYVNIAKEPIYDNDLFAFSSFGFSRQFTRIDLLKLVTANSFDSLKIQLLNLFRGKKQSCDISMIFLKINNGIKKPEVQKSNNPKYKRVFFSIFFFILSICLFVYTIYLIVKPFLTGLEF
ncbi:MAG TPA: PP2C family serine/threonine-protein phosphatase [Candidatus Cloacimonadota bacterium]|nr:PP2C family serine/threonine-protein phosphatase [Candidatus Cloacimonadota bacterium]